MEILKNTNAKTEYDYIRYCENELTVVEIRNIINNYTRKINPRHHGDTRRKQRNGVVCDSKLIGKSNRYGKCYLDIPMSFDIETTTLQNEELAFMWIWQFGLCDNVIIGRTWESFTRLLKKLQKAIKPLKNQRVLCFVANLGYEFQFIRKLLNVTDSFLKEQRKPCYIEHNNWLVFQDALLMTNSNLQRLAKDYTNTQKCVGDLDYNVIRTKETNTISNEEFGYIDNDVLILTEWARYYYDTYIKKGFKPLTITGVLEKKIRKAYEESDADIEGTKPQSEEEYRFIMSWLYRGGYTHANELYIEHDFNTPTTDNIASFDFTSSYPSIMALQKCFSGVWTDIENATIGKMISLSKRYCTQAIYTFYEIEATTDQTIESKHKCIQLENAVLDNGRVRSASIMSVALCDLDLLNYCDFYAWKRCDVTTAKISERRYLDGYFVKTMLEDYVKKDTLKKQHLNYSKEKALVNSSYGLCCKRTNDVITHYGEGEWTEESAKSYDEQMNEKPFSPYVGIYVSACARRNLLLTVKRLHDIGKDVLYCDTDSIKILNHDAQSQEVIEAYNRHIYGLIQRASKRYSVNIDSIHDLGMFDREHAEGITRFKCLGAKRYLISYLEGGKEKHEQTIAGLPKNILFKRHTPNEVYEMFRDGMCVNDCKLISKYIDEPTDIIVDGVHQHEESSIALLKSDFNMNIEQIWLQLYLQYQLTKNRERDR